MYLLKAYTVAKAPLNIEGIHRSTTLRSKTEAHSPDVAIGLTCKPSAASAQDAACQDQPTLT